jgi:hypothetical protein
MNAFRRRIVPEHPRVARALTRGVIAGVKVVLKEPFK